MRKWTGVCALLIGAVALGAAVAGHALQRSIESAHLFGSAPALYTHSLQTPYAYLVFFALLAAAVLIVRRLIEGVRDRSDQADWLVPALTAVARIAPRRLIVLVIGLQFAFLIVGELIEQALSSYDSVGLSAIFGAGHFCAPIVYIAIGLLASWLLIAFARAVRAGVADFAQFIITVIAQLRRPIRVRCAPALQLLALRCDASAPPPLARHTASRPPPAATALLV